MQFGKLGATLTLPAFNFAVEKIEITGYNDASSAVQQNIFVGDVAVSKETEGWTVLNTIKTNSFAINENYQTAGNIYTLKVTSSHNTKITKICIYKKTSSESLTTANSGFATYAASYPVNYSSLGLTCYQITLDEANNKVAYTSYTGVVPAKQAVLVQGEASKEYTLTKSEADENSKFSTDLKASNGNIVAADNQYYGFSTKNSVSGFYRVKNGTTIPANKGYLKLSSSSEEAKFFSFDGGNGTTGIGSIENIEKQIMLDNATIYNLAGQRVSKSYKGVIIVNGKKMVNK